MAQIWRYCVKDQCDDPSARMMAHRGLNDVYWWTQKFPYINLLPQYAPTLQVPINERSLRVKEGTNSLPKVNLNTMLDAIDNFKESHLSHQTWYPGWQWNQAYFWNPFRICILGFPLCKTWHNAFRCPQASTWWVYLWIPKGCFRAWH